MPFVQESIEFAPSPAPGEHQLGIETPADAPEFPYANGLNAAALRTRDVVLGHSGDIRKVLLSPSEPMTQRPYHSADALVVHGHHGHQARLSPDYARLIGGRLDWR